MEGRMILPTSTAADFGDAVMTEVQNNTNASNCSTHFDTAEWITTVVPVYVLLIAVLGIVFNVFVLMVFCLHKKPCTVAEIYLGNLAAADLILVSCLPFWAVYISSNFTNWPFGLFLCKVINFGIHMNTCCSIFFIVLVSIDRYGALVHTLSYNRMRRPKYGKLGCLLVWSFGLLLSVPILIYRDVKHKCNATTCYLNYPSKQLFFVNEGVQILLGFIIPISIISFCTVKIIQALSNRLMTQINSQNTEHKATTLVLAVLLAFLICWVPYHVVRIMETFQRAKVLEVNLTILDICIQIFIYLAFFNSVLNPILYVIVGKNFRKKAEEVFKENKTEVTLRMTSLRTNLLRTKSVKTSS